MLYSSDFQGEMAPPLLINKYNTISSNTKSYSDNYTVQSILITLIAPIHHTFGTICSAYGLNLPKNCWMNSSWISMVMWFIQHLYYKSCISEGQQAQPPLPLLL